MNEFTALAATKAPNLSPLITVFVKRALHAIQRGAIKSEADEVCYLLERLVIADRSLAGTIWADLRSSFCVQDHNVAAETFLIEFFLDKLLPLAVRDVSRRGLNCEDPSFPSFTASIVPTCL